MWKSVKYFRDPKAFIEYSSDMNDIYRIVDDYSSI